MRARERGIEKERERERGERVEIQFILCSMLGEAGRDILSPTRLCSGPIFPSALR